jgi:hypothetical protein
MGLGNDPQILLQAAKLVENHCDAIDINLGCPLSHRISPFLILYVFVSSSVRLSSRDR